MREIVSDLLNSTNEPAVPVKKRIKSHKHLGMIKGAAGKLQMMLSQVKSIQYIADELSLSSFAMKPYMKKKGKLTKMAAEVDARRRYNIERRIYSQSQGVDMINSFIAHWL
jgi:hypothetical protein